jgi:branched-chain amino acid transport system permease protein
MMLPNYRAWVVAASLTVCLLTWYVIERTKLGAYLRAGTENPKLVQAFGVNVPLMITLTYGFGVALAAFAGVLASPVIQINPLMGSNIIIIVFAVVVIGGMGSILGSVVTGLGLGVIEGLTRAGLLGAILGWPFTMVENLIGTGPVLSSWIQKLFGPEGSSTIVFVIMAIVLLVRPAGLFGREK